MHACAKVGKAQLEAKEARDQKMELGVPARLAEMLTINCRNCCSHFDFHVSLLVPVLDLSKLITPTLLGWMEATSDTHRWSLSGITAAISEGSVIPKALPITSSNFMGCAQAIHTTAFTSEALVVGRLVMAACTPTAVCGSRRYPDASRTPLIVANTFVGDDGVRGEHNGIERSVVWWWYHKEFVRTNRDSNPNPNL